MFDGAAARRINDGHEGWVGSTGGVEDLESHGGRPRDRVLAKCLSLVERVENETGNVRGIREWTSVAIARSAGVQILRERRELARLDDLRPARGPAAGIVESEHLHARILVNSGP